MVKKIIILYVEGETEEEFYNKLKGHLKVKTDNNFLIKVTCIKGNTKFANKLKCKFKKEIVDQYKDIPKIVALCYDTDGFEFGKHPAFDAIKLENELKEMGANKVIHLSANKTIEDYIMIDEEGVKKFLHLPVKLKANGKTGLDKIKYLYDKADKTYFKGSKTSGLISSLDMNKICCKKCENLSKLCNEINVKCIQCKKSLK